MTHLFSLFSSHHAWVFFRLEMLHAVFGLTANGSLFAAFHPRDWHGHIRELQQGNGAVQA